MGLALVRQAAVTRVLSHAVPPEWTRRLREISPDDLGISYLTFRWVPARRVTQRGATDTGRWVLYENIPRWGIPPELVTMLEDAPPRLLPPGKQVGRELFIDEYTHEQYRTRREWVRPFWVIQGPGGGHPITYTEMETALMQRIGRPTSPPRVGQLPYAPFDERVVQQILARDRLVALGRSLDALRAAATPAGIEREFEAAERDHRRQYLQWLGAELDEGNAFLNDYVRTADARHVLPHTSRADEAAADRLSDEFIETGVVPVGTAA